MNEILNIYNYKLYKALKEKVKGHIDVRNNNQTNSIHILIVDNNIRFEYEVVGLDEKTFNNTFNLEREINVIIKAYSSTILSQYLK